jgi:hypothetical protein
MLAVLVAIRDFLLAMALAWVGLTVEHQVNAGDRCGAETCETQRDR